MYAVLVKSVCTFRFIIETVDEDVKFDMPAVVGKTVTHL